jgi:hypothetical protein
VVLSQLVRLPVEQSICSMCCHAMVLFIWILGYNIHISQLGGLCGDKASKLVFELFLL